MSFHKVGLGKPWAVLVVAAITLLPAAGEAPRDHGNPDPSGTAAIDATGVALTPPHFPHQTDADIQQMFAMGKQVGTYAIFIYQWSQPDFKAVAEKVTEASHATGLIPVLALSPTQLGGARGELDLPANLNSVRHRSFSEKPIYESFLRDAVDLAKNKPPYLCLGTEINMLAFKDIHEYIYFAHIYKNAYTLVKKESPNTKVFVSFQWDFFYQMYKEDPKKVDEQKKLIDIFRPELDVLAFTSYPADRFGSPSEIPADYYSTLSRYSKPGDPVMFMEIGWPSSGKGSLTSQQQFVARLPELLGPVHPMLVAWSLLYDVGSGLPGGDLGSTGLLNSDGGVKPALAEFEKLKF
jgi:hypothetical protein